MAKLKQDFLKELLDKLLEDYQVKKRGETSYLTKRSNKRKRSTTPKAVDNMGKFSVNGRFASPLNKNRYLFQAWEKSKVKAGCPLNRITKTNRKFCRHDRPSTENVISPPGGFPLELVTLDYNQEKLMAKIKPVRLNKNEKKLICLLYLCHYEPFKPDKEYCTLMPVKETIVENSEVIFNFNATEKYIAAYYKKHIIFLCTVTLNKNENVSRYSETFSADLPEPALEETINELSST